MNSTTSIDAASAIELTVGLTTAYVANNALPTSELPALISRVHRAIIDLSTFPENAHGDVSFPSEAQIRRSVRRDGIVSFIDGGTYKTLKRHLATHGLHPASYRARYGLPADCPMVARDYAERRSKLARAIGLGEATARR